MDKTTDTTKVEETVDAEATKETVETTETKDEAKAKNSDIDYEKELEKERKGKPDPNKAIEAFKARQAKRLQEEGLGEEEVDELDKPMTRREAEAFFSQTQKQTLESQALLIAQGLTTNPKEAELIVEKWKNRTWPSHLSLHDQLEEAYAVTHSKRLIAERNEALRALKGKDTSINVSTGGHQDALKSPAPKVAPDLAASLKRAGFTHDNTDRKWKKKLPNGKYLVKDTPTARPVIV